MRKSKINLTVRVHSGGRSFACSALALSRDWEENGPAMGFQALEIGTSFMLYVLCSDEILFIIKLI